MAVSLGLWLSQKAIGGLLTQSAFYIIAILWYLSAYLSVTYALNGELKLHRRWTLRNYFATLATGFMRPMLFIVDLAFPNQSPEVLFPISCWGCLVTALLLSQWLIERNDLPIKAVLFLNFEIDHRDVVILHDTFSQVVQLLNNQWQALIDRQPLGFFEDLQGSATAEGTAFGKSLLHQTIRRNKNPVSGLQFRLDPFDLKVIGS